MLTIVCPGLGIALNFLMLYPDMIRMSVTDFTRVGHIAPFELRSVIHDSISGGFGKRSAMPFESSPFVGKELNVSILYLFYSVNRKYWKSAKKCIIQICAQ